MASSTSLKELSKAINTFIPEPCLPLPYDLIETIDAYLQRHHKYDDAAADRLQEELLSIHDKHVRSNVAAYGAWMSILRRLLPVLQTPERILEWFDACDGMLDRTDYDKAVVDETVATMVDLMAVIDEQGDTSDDDSDSNPIIDRLFKIWMDRFYLAHIEGRTGVEYNEQILREALGQFGKKRPKEFFVSLDIHFSSIGHRKAALRFFCDFMQGQPPHLHVITQTDMFTNLLTCLQQDTSTTIVSGALTALIMLLPHMPSSLVPYLPTLFNIYTRLLFWDRERSGSIEPPPKDTEQANRWEVSSYDPGVDELSVAHLSHYYTILYGLYPINFMDYIRKPQRYMRHANVANTDEVEVQPTEIRHQSERFRRCHLQHPNFYTLTIDSEKTDFSRWIKSEAAEVVAGCMELSMASQSRDFADPDAPPMPGIISPEMHEGFDRDRSDAALLSGSLSKVDSWRNSHFTCTDSASSNQTPSTMMRGVSQSSQHSNRDSGELKAQGSSPDSPTLPQLTISTSHTQLQDMIQSNKAIKSGLHQSLANDSVPSLSLSHQESVADKPAPSAVPPPQPAANSPMYLTNGANGTNQIAQLQRQILLLQNDLSFETYLKQQHMAHIGDLRRRQVVEAATEAETQNLIIMNRNLKSRYEDAKKTEMQVKKESEKSRALAKKWESDLAGKLKGLRDKSKTSATDMDAAKKELQDARDECKKLRQLVCDAEVKELNWKQNMQSIDIHGAEFDHLKGEVERLTVSERDHQAKELERRTAVQAATAAQNEAEAMRLRLAGRDNEVLRTKRIYQSQVFALQERLTGAQEERERLGRNANVAVEGSLVASRAKQADMQKQYALLARKYTALQSSLLDMQSEAAAMNMPDKRSSAPDAETDYLSLSASPIMMRARTHRLMSTTDASESTAYNMTAPLASKPETPAPAPIDVAHRPPSPSGSGSAVLSISPEIRHVGRGGLQNRKLKEKDKDKDKDKDKHKEDASSSKSKKDKKSSGLRGIRGFG